MLGGILAWAAGMMQIGRPWPDWATPFTIITLGLITYTALAAKLFGDAQSRQILKKNTAMLTEIAAGMKDLASGMKENTALLKEIAAGQAEIIRLLKAGAPAGAAAAGVRPSAATRANGRGGDNDSDGRTGHPASLNPGGAPEWKK